MMMTMIIIIIKSQSTSHKVKEASYSLDTQDVHLTVLFTKANCSFDSIFNIYSITATFKHYKCLKTTQRSRE